MTITQIIEEAKQKAIELVQHPESELAREVDKLAKGLRDRIPKNLKGVEALALEILGIPPLFNQPAVAGTLYSPYGAPAVAGLINLPVVEGDVLIGASLAALVIFYTWYKYHGGRRQSEERGLQAFEPPEPASEVPGGGYVIEPARARG